MNEKVGLTTTIPVEIIYAAGDIPVDLNNIFITSNESQRLVEEAEYAGYPRNICGWIKGLYSTVLETNDLNKIIAVTQGDCTNTHALMETLEMQGVKTVPFGYSYNQDRELLELQIKKLIEHFKVSEKEVLETKGRLDEVRDKVHKIDYLTWAENKVTGFENHLFLVNCSDFKGDIDEYEKEVMEFLQKVEEREPFTEEIRLGYIGVPPIIDDLYDYIETQNARVVFNEIQRQFSMPYQTDNLVEQYLKYTYPYNVFARLEDIKTEIEKRDLDGIIHYTQSFCFRQIDDLVFRERLDIPLLTLEGDKPGDLDARSKMRLDSFIEMLKS
ncbi:2-hydroxyacyl-CoA dehydratase family protein [Selenihalanaerobacter shriftii]|uniref:Benzoyl-CoA reductase/2-hydroxyglutaryl-CoA dehydratase subunit, BcrC/BadD/HgdB n=1 Tax=Selenihalanaerobacter shriftii TaxID=142842 RepID=A0A1T4QQX7_9FIRM|nr:2-hydroxyacyl-CoA dehydratase [Selenihalanaerobacter shriftii]SKA06017.1 Benzoyl-CoA reductase/2-hydroxyglutaryl-CoA dehydratase subunit, BcrC/BadD/HgdB [Selenihalanaerobacter shriftii]